MKIHLLLVILLTLSGCYSIPEIPGFEKEGWQAALSDCSGNREEMATILVANEEKLLAEGQAEIKALLGQPEEHELYNRNQKFFYYDLSKAGCQPIQRRLSVRFDALDRVKEVSIIVADQ